MNVLTVNAGSSSVRLAALEPEDESLSRRASGHFSGDLNDPAEMLRVFLNDHIVLDPAANRAAIGTEMCISNRCSEAEVWVIPVDEAAILAQAALSVMAAREAVNVQEGRP